MDIYLALVIYLLLLLILNSYIAYPIIMKIAALFVRDSVANVEKLQPVSILISVYNEEKVILEKIKNIIELEYDQDKIEVLIGSDGSTDNTNKILEELNIKYEWLSVNIFNNRRGKARVLNDLANSAKNDILVFTDANTIFRNDLLKNLIPKLGAPEVGGISGRLILIEPSMSFEKSIEEKKYWEYETFIKMYEGQNGILIGANGGIFAIKKHLFRELPVDKPVTDDLFICLSVLGQNHKFLYEKEAVAYEEVAPKLIHEFRRKVRFAASNFQTLIYFKKLLFNKRFLLSYAFWSHKIIRWFSPLILSALFILTVLAFNLGYYFKILLLVQIIFLVLALCGFLFRKLNYKMAIISLPFYFIMTNIALLKGLLNFIQNKHKAYWDSTPRS